MTTRYNTGSLARADDGLTQEKSVSATAKRLFSQPLR